MREYATPAAFRSAVEAKLRQRARHLGVPAYVLRRQAGLERLTVRLRAVAPGRWALKGGFALETRLGGRARVSVDPIEVWLVPLERQVAGKLHSSISCSSGSTSAWTQSRYETPSGASSLVVRPMPSRSVCRLPHASLAWAIEGRRSRSGSPPG
jgi:hypothetical protein